LRRKLSKLRVGKPFPLHCTGRSGKKTKKSGNNTETFYISGIRWKIPEGGLSS